MLVRLLRTITTCLFQLRSRLGHSPFRPLIDLQLNRDREQLRTLPYQNSWWEILQPQSALRFCLTKSVFAWKHAVAFSLLLDFPANVNIVYSFSLDGRLIDYFVLEIECQEEKFSQLQFAEEVQNVALPVPSWNFGPSRIVLISSGVLCKRFLPTFVCWTLFWCAVEFCSSFQWPGEI